MADLGDPQFFQPYTVTWPKGATGRVEVREFVEDDTPVREVRLGDGVWQRFPVGDDIHL